MFDKCKVIHALKQPKNLLRLFSKPKIQTCISEQYGLYCYECKEPRCNSCASYIQECSSFITSNGYNWKILIVILIVIVLMFYIFHNVTLAMVIPHTLAKL